MYTNRSTTLHIYVHNEVSGLSLMSYSTMANVIEFQNLPIHIHKNLETMYNLCKVCIKIPKYLWKFAIYRVLQWFPNQKTIMGCKVFFLFYK